MRDGCLHIDGRREDRRLSTPVLNLILHTEGTLPRREVDLMRGWKTGKGGRVLVLEEIETLVVVVVIVVFERRPLPSSSMISGGNGRGNLIRCFLIVLMGGRERG